MIAQIAGIMLPVFLIIGCGALYGRFRSTSIGDINTLNLELFVPLLVFAVLAKREVPLEDYGELALAGCIVVLGSGIVLWPLTRLLGLDYRTFLPPMMFNNAGNMGIPLLVLAFGEAALPAAIVLFVVEMLLHFSIGFYMLDPAVSLWRRLRVPVIVAAIAGMAVNFSGLAVPPALLEAMTMLGEVCIPLMLFTLGIRMLDIDFGSWKLGMIGALACPLSGLLLAWPALVLLDLDALQTACVWVFAALPPAVLNYMVAERYNQEPKKVATLVLTGNFASLVVIPLVLTQVLTGSALG